MKRPLVFMFPGQGVQYYHMGNDLYRSNAVFRHWMDTLDAIARDILAESVVKKIYDPKETIKTPFDRLSLSHPAIFMVSYALARVFIEAKIKPDLIMGSSMGVFCAACVADALPVEDALTAVISQAGIIEKTCAPGAMTTALCTNKQIVENRLLGEDLYLAAHNYDRHFVICGPCSSMESLHARLKELKIAHQSLPVRYGFHSPLIDAAEKEFMAHISRTAVSACYTPMILTTQAGIVREFKPDDFWTAVRKPIAYAKTIEDVEKQHRRPYYLDLGPSGTLQLLTRKNLAAEDSGRCAAVMTPFFGDKENLKNVIRHFGDNRKKIQNRKAGAMLTYVFTGQGAQFKGMGEKIFDQYDDLVAAADKVLGYSVKELCVHDSDNRLNQTQYTQPAIYAVNALLFQQAQAEKGPEPDYLAGHSIGEYNALLAAGAFDFETGLTLVKKRGELMSRVPGGGMAAVIGLNEQAVIGILDSMMPTEIEIANLNAPFQIIIAGPLDQIKSAKIVFEEKGAKRYIPLNVSGAFHTRAMTAVAQELEKLIASIDFKPLKIPVISNLHARPYTLEDLKTTLIQQVYNPVKWTESIRYLMGRGKMSFREIGPRKVLTSLIDQIAQQAEPIVDETARSENIVQTSDTESVSYDNHEPVAAIVRLGSPDFKKDYKTKYAYVAGTIYGSIATSRMVIQLAKAGLIGILGTGGLDLKTIEQEIKTIRNELTDHHCFGVQLGYTLFDAAKEEALVDLLLGYDVNCLEVSGYMEVPPALVRFRFAGLSAETDAAASARRHVVVKVSRPQIADLFMRPPRDETLETLVADGRLSARDADLARRLPVAGDICVVADSAGPTDKGNLFTLLPVIRELRDKNMKKYKFPQIIRVGAAGGIGTPESAAAAFMLGADFISTTSINHCTCEAALPDAAKDLLQKVRVGDTDYAPAGIGFEMGEEVQVLKKGSLFAARAKKLRDLYRFYNALEEIDPDTLSRLEQHYFNNDIETVFKNIEAGLPSEEVEMARDNPKFKMGLVFKSYLENSERFDKDGNEDRIVNYQIPCSAALGAFNQWVKDTTLQKWRERRVDDISMRLMNAAARYFNDRYLQLLEGNEIESVH